MSNPLISNPLSYFSGYPSDAKTTHTAALSSNSNSTSDNFPSIHASITSMISFFILGRTTCASGSPKRALYSKTFGPSSVSINPVNKIPVNGLPSTAIASIVGW